MVLLSVLSNILASLEPFIKCHQEIFSAEMLAPFMSDVKVKTDEERISEVCIYIYLPSLRAQTALCGLVAPWWWC